MKPLDGELELVAQALADYRWVVTVRHYGTRYPMTRADLDRVLEAARFDICFPIHLKGAA